MLAQAIKRRFASQTVLEMLKNDAVLYGKLAADNKSKYYVLRLINSDNSTLRVDNA